MNIYNLFCNYFLLITITAFLHVLTGIGWLTTLLLPIIIFICVFKIKYKIKIQINLMDILWILSFLWMVSTWLYNDFPNKGIMIVRCISSQIAYMMVYWIARKSNRNVIGNIITSSYLPLILTCIIGIYCFLFHPSWYESMVYKTLEDHEVRLSEMELMEAFRLRSIFDSPYTLAYFTSITLIFLFFSMLDNHKNAKDYYLFIFLLFVTLLLTMMRAPIVCTLIGFFVSLVYSFKYRGGKLLAKYIVVGFFVSFLLIIVFINIDSSSLDFLFSKFNTVTSNTDELLEKRLFLQEADGLLFGDGVGRHAIYAPKYGGYGMLDGEYMKMIQEQGYIGLFFFLLFVIFALLKCIFYIKELSFEFCLLIMLLICMIGANPLSTGDKHPIIFWLAFGQIARFKSPICFKHNL